MATPVHIVLKVWGGIPDVPVVFLDKKAAIAAYVDGANDMFTPGEEDEFTTIEDIQRFKEESYEGTNDIRFYPDISIEGTAAGGLLAAAENVIERWETGDLAEAVRALSRVVASVKEA